MSAVFYYEQLAVAKRFQEFIPIEKYAGGQHISPLVDYGKIDRVPVSIIVPLMDGLCPAEYSEWAYSMISSPQKFIRYERGGHAAPAVKSYDSYVRQMINTIETG